MCTPFQTQQSLRIRNIFDGQPRIFQPKLFYPLFIHSKCNRIVNYLNLFSYHLRTSMRSHDIIPVRYSLIISSVEIPPPDTLRRNPFKWFFTFYTPRSVVRSQRYSTRSLVNDEEVVHKPIPTSRRCTDCMFSASTCAPPYTFSLEQYTTLSMGPLC